MKYSQNENVCTKSTSINWLKKLELVQPVFPKELKRSLKQFTAETVILKLTPVYYPKLQPHFKLMLAQVNHSSFSHHVLMILKLLMLYSRKLQPQMKYVLLSSLVVGLMLQKNFLWASHTYTPTYINLIFYPSIFLYV